MRVVGDLSPAIVEQVESAARAVTLEDVLAWAHSRGCEVACVIVQDEYTHDVIVRGPAPAFLCFDTT